MASERDTPSSSAAAAEGPVRHIVDPDHRPWKVFEAGAPAYDRRSGKCLIFENSDVVRRVRTYPATWYELPDAELYALSLRF
jgi:hypothetical protein